MVRKGKAKAVNLSAAEVICARARGKARGALAAESAIIADAYAEHWPCGQVKCTTYTPLCLGGHAPLCDLGHCGHHLGWLTAGVVCRRWRPDNGLLVGLLFRKATYGPLGEAMHRGVILNGRAQ